MTKGSREEAYQVISPNQVKYASLDSPYIEKIGTSLKDQYNQALSKLQLMKEKCLEHGSKIKIVYTNLHGTGIVFVPELMRQWGFTNFQTVAEQEKPDGDFPTVDFPNPEEPASLELGVKTMENVGGDLLIATDPDGDRMRVAVKHKGKIELLNGNQIACLLLNHILSHLETTPANGVVIKTIVTTDLFRKIANKFHVECVDVLTGFKYIGELIHQYEDGSKTFIFGGEESYGTLFGTCVRDKDGVMASLLIAEATLAAQLEGKTLVDKIEELYTTFLAAMLRGSVASPSQNQKEGHEEMQQVMEKLRTNPPHMIHRLEVVLIEDYLRKKRFNLKTREEELLNLPVSDVLNFCLETQVPN